MLTQSIRAFPSLKRILTKCFRLKLNRDSLLSEGGTVGLLKELDHLRRLVVTKPSSRFVLPILDQLHASSIVRYDDHDNNANNVLLPYDANAATFGASTPVLKRAYPPQGSKKWTLTNSVTPHSAFSSSEDALPIVDQFLQRSSTPTAPTTPTTTFSGPEFVPTARTPSRTLSPKGRRMNGKWAGAAAAATASISPEIKLTKSPVLVRPQKHHRHSRQPPPLPAFQSWSSPGGVATPLVDTPFHIIPPTRPGQAFGPPPPHHHHPRPHRMTGNSAGPGGGELTRSSAAASVNVNANATATVNASEPHHSSLVLYDPANDPTTTTTAGATTGQTYSYVGHRHHQNNKTRKNYKKYPYADDDDSWYPPIPSKGGGGELTTIATTKNRSSSSYLRRNSSSSSVLVYLPSEGGGDESTSIVNYKYSYVFELYQYIIDHESTMTEVMLSDKIEEIRNMRTCYFHLDYEVIRLSNTEKEEIDHCLFSFESYLNALLYSKFRIFELDAVVDTQLIVHHNSRSNSRSRNHSSTRFLQLLHKIIMRNIILRTTKLLVSIENSANNAEDSSGSGSSSSTSKDDDVAPKTLLMEVYKLGRDVSYCRAHQYFHLPSHLLSTYFPTTNTTTTAAAKNSATTTALQSYHTDHDSEDETESHVFNHLATYLSDAAEYINSRLLEIYSGSPSTNSAEKKDAKYPPPGKKTNTTTTSPQPPPKLASQECFELVNYIHAVHNARQPTRKRHAPPMGSRQSSRKRPRSSKGPPPKEEEEEGAKSPPKEGAKKEGAKSPPPEHDKKAKTALQPRQPASSSSPSSSSPADLQLVPYAGSRAVAVVQQSKQKRKDMGDHQNEKDKGTSGSSSSSSSNVLTSRSRSSARRRTRIVYIGQFTTTQYYAVMPAMHSSYIDIYDPDLHDNTHISRIKGMVKKAVILNVIFNPRPNPDNYFEIMYLSREHSTGPSGGRGLHYNASLYYCIYPKKKGGDELQTHKLCSYYPYNADDMNSLAVSIPHGNMYMMSIGNSIWIYEVNADNSEVPTCILEQKVVFPDGDQIHSSSIWYFMKEITLMVCTIDKCHLYSIKKREFNLLRTIEIHDEYDEMMRRSRSGKKQSSHYTFNSMSTSILRGSHVLVGVAVKYHKEKYSTRLCIWPNQQNRSVVNQEIHNNDQSESVTEKMSIHISRSERGSGIFIMSFISNHIYVWWFDYDATGMIPYFCSDRTQEPISSMIMYDLSLNMMVAWENNNEVEHIDIRELPGTMRRPEVTKKGVTTITLFDFKYEYDDGENGKGKFEERAQALRDDEEIRRAMNFNHRGNNAARIENGNNVTNVPIPPPLLEYDAGGGAGGGAEDDGDAAGGGGGGDPTQRSWTEFMWGKK